MPRVHVENQLHATPDVVTSGICPHDLQIGREEMPLGVWGRGVHHSQPSVYPESGEQIPRGTISLVTSTRVASFDCDNPDNKTPRQASQVLPAFTRGAVPTKQRRLLPGPSGQRRRHVSWHVVAALVIALLVILVAWREFVGQPTEKISQTRSALSTRTAESARIAENAKEKHRNNPRLGWRPRLFVSPVLGSSCWLCVRGSPAHGSVALASARSCLALLALTCKTSGQYWVCPPVQCTRAASCPWHSVSLLGDITEFVCQNHQNASRGAFILLKILETTT